MSCLSSWVPVHFSATAAFILAVGSSQLHTLLRREVDIAEREQDDRRNNAMAFCGAVQDDTRLHAAE
jgi:hypothetical protein